MPSPRRHAAKERHERMAFVCALALTTANLAAQDGGKQAGDADTRAALLRAMVVLKIAPYLVIETPATTRKEYRIGVVGSDTVGAAIQKDLPGKKVGDLPVVVVAIDPTVASKGASAHTCDLLWLAKSVDAATQKQILAAHAEHPTTLVSEQAGFVASGGSVQLFVQENSIRFEVNADALKQKGIRASSQLLKLSRKGPKE